MTFYRSFWEAVKGLPRKDRQPIVEAIIAYGLDGESPKGLTQGQSAFFLLCKPTLDASRRKAENGKKGGSKPEANGKQTGSKPEANGKQTGSENENEIENEGEKEYEYEIENENECYIGEPAAPQRATRFSPPTLEEVAAYCVARGNNVDPHRWYDHYTSNGWLVGKNKMKDWRAAVRTWERSDYQAPAKKSVGSFMGLVIDDD